MEITHIGHSCFKIKGKKTVLITDPFKPEFVGLKVPDLICDVVTVSHQHPDHNHTSLVFDNPLIVSGPGEYEIKGIKIVGIRTFHDSSSGSQRGRNTVYRIEIDGVSIVHLGDLGHKLNDKDIEVLDGVDILMIPVGGLYTFSTHEAVETIAQLEPKIVIPMHYNSPKLNQSNFGKLNDISVFLKEMGKENLPSQPKILVTKDKLPVEQTIVVLE